MSNDNPYQAPTAPPTMTTAQDTPMSSQGRPLATRLERFLGALIDGVINTVISIPLAFLVIVPLAAGMAGETGVVMMNMMTAVGGFILGMIILTLVHGYTLSKTGQTIGKVLMKTQIVSSETGKILPLPQVIGMRYGIIGAIASIPFIGGIIGIVNGLMIFRQSYKCLHDDIAGTVVIKFQG